MVIGWDSRENRAFPPSHCIFYLNSMPKLLPRSFYLDPPDIVARKLLGKLIRRRIDGHRVTGRIVEIEAYLGLDDPASHSYIGKTTRTPSSSGRPASLMSTSSTGCITALMYPASPTDMPAASSTALEPVEGLNIMARLRKLPASAAPRLLTSGPGRLCQALDITRAAHNGLDVTSRTSVLQILDDGSNLRERSTPRIGINKAVEHPLRFVIRAISLSADSFPTAAGNLEL